MKCGNSIVQQEQVRKVYVNGRLDHEESDGIGLCVYEKPGEGRVMTSWPKREKVLLINDVPFCYIGRTVANTPICWTIDEEIDTSTLLGIKVSRKYTYRSRYNSSKYIIMPVSIEAEMSLNPRLYHNNITIGNAPDHLSARTLKKSKLDFDIYLTGRWYATETDYALTSDGTRHGSAIVIRGYADNLDVKVARLVVESGNDIEATATAYGDYIAKDAWYAGALTGDASVSVSGVSCEVKDWKEE